MYPSGWNSPLANGTDQPPIPGGGGHSAADIGQTNHRMCLCYGRGDDPFVTIGFDGRVSLSPDHCSGDRIHTRRVDKMEIVYEWVRNLVYYLIATNLILQLLPDHSSKKYLRFFIGLMLMVLMAKPALELLQIKDSFTTFYLENEIEQNRKEMEDAARYLERITKEGQTDG